MEFVGVTAALLYSVLTRPTSLAVLPFGNTSNVGNSYLSDGIPKDIIENAVK